MQINLRKIIAMQEKCYFRNNVEDEEADKLSNLFNALRKCSFKIDYSLDKEVFIPNFFALERMLKELSEPMQAVKTPSNPWMAANLRRDEVRNASVLAWFLDPRNGHGMAELLTQHILKEINKKLDFPEKSSKSFSVLVEEYPDGLGYDRVDILIDDPKFFVIIEVKIDASEQTEQIERYCRIANARACDGRPWAVIFLTTTGRNPKTVSSNEQRVIPISWPSIGRALQKQSRSLDEKIRYLSREFASHVFNF